MLILGNEISDHLLPQVCVGPRETHCYWHFDVHLLSSSDDALSNRVAFHYSPENVNKNALHTWVPIKDLERSLYLFSLGATAHVKEVSGFTALKLYNVHCSHSQTGAVHHAANVSVERNVVQANSSGLRFIEVGVGARI